MMKIKFFKNKRSVNIVSIGLASCVCLFNIFQSSFYANAQETITEDEIIVEPTVDYTAVEDESTEEIVVEDATEEKTIPEFTVTDDVIEEDEGSENEFTADEEVFEEDTDDDSEFTGLYKFPTVTIGGVVYTHGKVVDCDKDYQGEITIQSSVVIEDKTYPITTINKEAFKDCTGITKVTMLENTDADEDRAYYGLRIEESAFEGCTSLKEVVLSKDVTKLDKHAFDGCSALESINLNDLTARTVGEYAFYNCRNLTIYNLPTSVTEIGEGAFMNAGFTDLVLPDRGRDSGSLTIGSYAFDGCDKIEKLTIKDTMVHMGTQVFTNCKSLKEITMPITIYYGQAVFSGCDNVKKLTYTNLPQTEWGTYNIAWGGYIGNITGKDPILSEKEYYDMAGMFEGASDIEVVLSDDVKNIGYRAFNGFSQMTKLTVSGKNYNTSPYAPDDSTFEIDAMAFKDCTGLTRIDIPEATHKYNDIMIHGAAFAGCTNLSTITFPASTTEIYFEGSAFRKCASLKSIIFPAKLKKISFEEYYAEDDIKYQGWFEGSGLESVYMNNSELYIYSYATGVEKTWDSIFGNYNCHAYIQIFPTNVVIYGKKDSSAQAYAKYYGNPFKLLDKNVQPQTPVEFIPIEGGNGPMDTQPAVLDDTEAITLVKGQKFILGNKDWKSSASGIVSVSKNTVTAKKAGQAILKRLDKEINVTVIAPAIPKAEKTIKMVAGDIYNLTPLEVGDLPVAYESLAPDIATVNEEGVVTAISKGSATINAYVNGVIFKYTIKVSDVPSGKYDFTQEIKLVPNQTVQVKITGFKAAKATWTSDLPAAEAPKGYVFANGIVMINKSGKITATGVGTTVLTATGGSTEPANITVTVLPTVTRTLHLNKGTSKTIKLFGVKGTPTWITEDAGITIKGNKITGNAAGEKHLTAICGNFEYHLVVYVEDPSINDSAFSGSNYKYSIKMASGETKQITFENVSQKVSFTGKNNNIAFVDQDLVIHARSKGKTSFSTIINGKKVTINVTVE